jgi:hypothetical protein
MEATNETTLYQSGATLVTNRQVRVGEHSFPLSSLRGVSVTPPVMKRSYGAVALAIGIVLLIVGYIVWNGVLLSPMVGGIALVIAGAAILATAHEHYLVRLHEASGGVTALKIADQAQAQHLATTLTQEIERAETNQA